MSTLDMHRLAGAESAIRAEMDAARIKARQQLAPVGLDQQGRRSTRIGPDAPTVINSHSAAEVLHRADVQRAARWLRVRRRLIDAAWWLAVPVATACAYALARN